MNKGDENISERVILENIICTNRQQIANEYDNYFFNHPKNIQNTSKIFSNLFFLLNLNCRESMFFFRGCTEIELLLEINILKKR